MNVKMRGQDMIDLARYPIDQPGSSLYNDVLDQVRADLARDGCAVLRGFLTPEGVASAVTEADNVADRGIAAIRAPMSISAKMMKACLKATRRDSSLTAPMPSFLRIISRKMARCGKCITFPDLTIS